MGEVTTDDLLETKIKTIQFLKSKVLDKTYLMLFICDDMNASIHLMQLFINNPYYFKLYTIEKHKYKLVFGFKNGEEELFQIIESETLLSHFQTNEIAMFTTGYFVGERLHMNETILDLQDYPFFAKEILN